MDIRLEFDIWNNVTYLVNDDVWYKQSFTGDEIIKYEDSMGNYWTKEFGGFPYLLVTFYEVERKNILHPPSNSSTLICEYTDTEIKYHFKLSFIIYPNTPTSGSQLISNHLVEVQPMSAPNMNLFYMDSNYKKETWFQKIKKKINLDISKIYRIFVPDNLKI